MYTKLSCKLLTASFLSRVANVSGLWAQFGPFETFVSTKQCYLQIKYMSLKKE